jgi:hypothetical protein
MLQHTSFGIAVDFWDYSEVRRQSLVLVTTEEQVWRAHLRLT